MDTSRGLLACYLLECSQLLAKAGIVMPFGVAVAPKMKKYVGANFHRLIQDLCI